MKVLSCSLENFGSYKKLEFDFDSKGLALIKGDTGSGKSTLCDVIPWCLFGRTAKGGAADEVLRWPGDEITFVRIQLEIADKSLVIRRRRGPKAKENDLCFFTSEAGLAIRGKDLQDTQKLINAYLGIDYELYLSAAYFHEFSQTAQFFSTTAKNRRAICEQMMDLDLAVKLKSKALDSYKATQKKLTECESNIRTAMDSHKTIDRMLDAETVRFINWRDRFLKSRSEVTTKIKNFDDDRQKELVALEVKKLEFLEQQEDKVLKLKSKIKAIATVDSDVFSAKRSVLEKQIETIEMDAKCPTCGLPQHSTALADITEQLYSLRIEEIAQRHKQKEKTYLQEQLSELLADSNPYLEQIERLKVNENQYIQQLEDLNKQKNPHREACDRLREEGAATVETINTLNKQKDTYTLELMDLELLQEVIEQFRSAISIRTINELETNTNKLLNDFFDAEIRVTFETAESDKIDVTIFKDGNQCVYSQLSKGQRQMLKLCFGISVMRSVANRHGTKFHQVFLDESLDGCDDNIKLKAVRMLESLQTEYDSIFLVEHSETVKAMVDNSYQVRLINGESVIGQD